MKYLLSVLLALLGGVGIASADVVTNTTCQIGTGPTVSNPTGCSMNPPNSASAVASLTVNQLTPVSGADSFTNFTIDVAGSVTATPFFVNPGPGGISSNATATANITNQFFTAGPVRQGVITFSANVRNFGEGPGNDSATAAVSVGSLPGSCLGNYGCSGLLTTVAPRSLSFTLGNTFAISFNEAFAAYGDPLVEGTGFANGAVNLNFQLFEADGKTPVTIFAAPEPDTFGLLLISFAGLCAAVLLPRSSAARTPQN